MFLGRKVRALGRGQTGKQTDRQTYPEPTKDWRPMAFSPKFSFLSFVSVIVNMPAQ